MRPRPFIVSAVILIALASFVVGCGGSDSGSSPVGDGEGPFLDIDNLERSIKKDLQGQYDDPQAAGYDPGLVLEDVFCIRESKLKFTCATKYNSGYEGTLTATVSADGESWISE